MWPPAPALIGRQKQTLIAPFGPVLSRCSRYRLTNFPDHTDIEADNSPDQFAETLFAARISALAEAKATSSWAGGCDHRPQSNQGLQH